MSKHRKIFDSQTDSWSVFKELCDKIYNENKLLIVIINDKPIIVGYDLYSFLKNNYFIYDGDIIIYNNGDDTCFEIFDNKTGNIWVKGLFYKLTNSEEDNYKLSNNGYLVYSKLDDKFFDIDYLWEKKDLFEVLDL